MELLKKYFPFSFTEKQNLPSLVVILMYYLVAMMVAGLIFWVMSLIPIVNILGWIVGSVAELYLVGGAVLAVLDYFKLLK